MYQLNPLLQESTVARRLVDNGIVTDPKTIRMMIRKGWIPTKKRTVRGLRRSATNVAKKLGYKPITRDNNVLNSFSVPITKDKQMADFMLGQSVEQAAHFSINPVKHKFKVGDMFIPHDPSRYTYKAAKKNPLAATPLQAAAVSWHEGREAARQAKHGDKMLQVSKKFIDHISQPNIKGKIEALPPEKVGDFLNQINKVQQMGGHYPGVMRDEAKLNNILKRRYGVDFQSNVTANIARTPMEKELGKMSAKQDFKTRRQTYNDMIKYIDSL